MRSDEKGFTAFMDPNTLGEWIQENLIIAYQTLHAANHDISLYTQYHMHRTDQDGGGFSSIQKSVTVYEGKHMEFQEYLQKLVSAVNKRELSDPHPSPLEIEVGSPVAEVHLSTPT